VLKEHKELKKTGKTAFGSSLVSQTSKSKKVVPRVELLKPAKRRQISNMR
jgi:predicted YcjX-like family ATPase